MINLKKVISGMCGLGGFIFGFLALLMILSNKGANYTQDGFPIESYLKIGLFCLFAAILFVACIYYYENPERELKDNIIREKKMYKKIFNK